jgi:hypothetical protein
MTALRFGFNLNQCANRVNLIVKVTPVGVHFLDQLKLPVSIPFFELLLALYGCFNGMMMFVSDQQGDAIFGTETLK